MLATVTCTAMLISFLGGWADAAVDCKLQRHFSKLFIIDNMGFQCVKKGSETMLTLTKCFIYINDHSSESLTDEDLQDIAHSDSVLGNSMTDDMGAIERCQVVHNAVKDTQLFFFEVDSDIVSHFMSWDMMEQKINAHIYYERKMNNEYTYQRVGFKGVEMIDNLFENVTCLMNSYTYFVDGNVVYVCKERTTMHVPVYAGCADELLTMGDANITFYMGKIRHIHDYAVYTDYGMKMNPHSFSFEAMAGQAPDDATLCKTMLTAEKTVSMYNDLTMHHKLTPMTVTNMSSVTFLFVKSQMEGMNSLLGVMDVSEEE